MIKRCLFCAMAAASLWTSTAHAQAAMTEAQKRAQVVPLIRALTDCVAKTALYDTAAPLAYRSGTFNAYIVRLIGRCPDYFTQLQQVYDRVYGQGELGTFIDGDYANDLPRAILRRIKPQLEAKVEVLTKSEAERAARIEEERQAELAREADERRVEEARERVAEQARQERAQQEAAERQRQIALAEQQAAAAKAAASQAQAEAKAAAAKAEAERLERVETAKKAETLLVDQAASCARKQLKSLVRSGESADVLATAVMTICGEEVGHALDSGVEEFKLEHQVGGSDLAEGIVRERLRSQAREQVIALAVQAKAGVGAFAPASTSN